VFELGDGVGVFVAERLDRLVVPADVAAKSNSVTSLVAVARAEVGDLKADLYAVACGKPGQVKTDSIKIEGEGIAALVGGHSSSVLTPGRAGGSLPGP
jgi:hypothetical protein